MTTVDRIKSICSEQNIPISRLESDLAFGNGYISGLKKGSVPSDRLQKISEYLGVTKEYLIGGQDEKYIDENARLVALVRSDKHLTNALQIYFTLSDAKKKHIVELINLLGE